MPTAKTLDDDTLDVFYRNGDAYWRRADAVFGDSAGDVASTHAFHEDIQSSLLDLLLRSVYANTR